jgi:hypothetical protein
MEENGEKGGTMEDTEKRRAGRELLTTAVRGFQFSELFHNWKCRNSPEKGLAAVTIILH